MDKKILDTIKQKLFDEKQQLERELVDFAKKDSTVDDNYKSKFPDFGNKEDENAAEVAVYGDRLSLEHTLEVQLRDVNKALERISEGKYGNCQYCGKPIEEKRLLIRPTSNSCVDCKKRLKGEN